MSILQSRVNTKTSLLVSLEKLEFLTTWDFQLSFLRQATPLVHPSPPSPHPVHLLPHAVICLRHQGLQEFGSSDWGFLSHLFTHSTGQACLRKIKR